MGISFSCPGDNALDALLRSIGYAGSAPALFESKLVIQGSVSFNRRHENEPFLETKFSVTSSSSEKSAEAIESPKHEAAVKLQKVYKSFRTRRQLADCAVLVEQRWWKLLDFALLKRSSVSFFDIERPESVISKWSRAKSRAAKVGKGLSKDKKAQKLALQHWLEAIDPRHRYGHNLHFYYDRWLRCESRQPFFYWLDVGEGKEVSIDEKCARPKLQQQCIKYLGPKEREAYEVVVEDGKFLYKKSGQILDTSGGRMDSKWIFVLSTSKTLYVGQKRKGTFQHSSFLAGGATSAAGRLDVENGVLKAVWPHSGHYRPTQENFQEFLTYLKDHNVDLTDVKESPTGEEEEVWSRLRSSHSEVDLTRSITEVKDVQYTDTLTKSELGESDEDSQPTESSPIETDAKVDESGAYRFRKPNLFEEDHEESEGRSMASELILRRMNSKKGMKSLQLGQQLSFKWTTGAGPRIGCVRDYPSELQVRALEQVSLSPRTSAGASRFCSSPRTPLSPTPKLQI